jgi:hypothetical protein
MLATQALCSGGEQQGIETVARQRPHVRIQEIRQRPPDRAPGPAEIGAADARGRKELGLGLVNKIKRDLGLK